MTIVHFTARLLNDAIISERSATEGGHRTLDYIPGAALLGAAAAGYSTFRNDAFTVFHSGKVRFGNAYPLTPGGETSLPVPLSWHAEKGEELHGSVERVKNLVHASDADFENWDDLSQQQKQLRSGYFSISGIKIDPTKCYRLKTAINREKQGMAEEEQLFGYQALAAGSLWRFAIAFDVDLSPDLVQKVADSFSGTIRIGRSRSAEYGQMEVRKVAYTETFNPVPGKDLILYCSSDLALTDEVTGSPGLIPSKSQFGISNADFAASRSYIRVRGYASFNRTRKRFDLERQVIAKGSVLVFTRPEGFSVQELRDIQQRLASGIGLYRQDGLGQVLVNPQFLAEFKFKPAALSLFPLLQATKQEQVPDLAQWLKNKDSAREKEREAIALVDCWINELVAGPCPNNSQWGQLRNIALQGKKLDGILAGAIKLCTKGVSKTQWGRKVTVSQKTSSYADFILETVLDATKVKEVEEKGLLTKEVIEGYKSSSTLKLEEAKNRLYLLGNRLPHKNNLHNGGTL